MSARTLKDDIPHAPPPPGYFLDAQGRWIPERYRSEIDALRDQTVTDLTDIMGAGSAQVSAIKSRVFADLASYVQLVAETHGVQLTGRTGRVIQIRSDGCRRIERRVAPRMRVGVAVLAAEQLVRELLDELTRGVDPDLAAIANQLFARDAAGNISPSRLLLFIRMKLSSPLWLRAQAAVRAALESDGEAVYFLAYSRPDPMQPWQQTVMDFSRVPFAVAPLDGAASAQEAT